MQDFNDQFLSPAVFSQLLLEMEWSFIAEENRVKAFRRYRKTYSQMQMYLVKWHI